MQPTNTCPECAAPWTAGLTCQDHFFQMLYWENEFSGHGVVHHLAVLCYYLQHPGLYSPEGLAEGLQLLVDFVERKMPPQHVRRQNRERVNSSNRSWKITARPGHHGAYAQPVNWRMTTTDVVAAGPDAYIATVEKWAKTVLEDLKASNNL